MLAMERDFFVERGAGHAERLSRNLSFAVIFDWRESREAGHLRGVTSTNLSVQESEGIDWALCGKKIVNAGLFLSVQERDINKEHAGSAPFQFSGEFSPSALHVGVGGCI